MNLKFKQLYFGVAVAVLASAASTSWAQSYSSPATVCTKVGGVGTSNITIAVASNFYAPAQAWAQDYINDGNSVIIQICHNSTGLLKNEIEGTNLLPAAAENGYSALYAANASTPNTLASGYGIGSAFDYLTGIPVLWTNTSVSGLSGSNLVVTGQAATYPQGKIYSPGYVTTDYVKVNQTNVTDLAIGTPSLAPYGLAAQNILTAMGSSPGQWVTPESATCTGSSWICQYSNIDLTYAAVLAGTQDAGFVSKAQICSLVHAGTARYVEFSQSAYTIQQKGLLLNYGSAGQKTLAADMKDFLLDPDYLADFKDEHCYL